MQTAGNEAFQSGKHAEAIEYYTAAISCSVESRPFAAICFCNRAATFQAIGQIVDAIADCTLSVALDGNYEKVFCLFHSFQAVNGCDFHFGPNWFVVVYYLDDLES